MCAIINNNITYIISNLHIILNNRLLKVIINLHQFEHFIKDAYFVK